MAKSQSMQHQIDSSDTSELAVRLDAESYAKLTFVAIQRGLEPDDLASSWIQYSLAFVGLGAKPVDSFIPNSDTNGSSHVSDLSNSLREHEVRLAAIERFLGISESSDPSKPPAGRAGPQVPPRRSRAPGLHEEIVTVLTESDGPMSAGDIADAVRRRGRYQTPRSDKPVTASTISTRVSNPFYRDLFLREDRKITLAK